MAIELIGTCVDLPACDIERYDRHSREITPDHFRTYLKADEFKELSVQFGYPSSRKHGMILIDDPCVTYSIGVYAGKEVFCVHHSAIHYIYNRSALEKKQ